jgi:DNA invertase Pin-like site-specific DNA recombinase
MNEMKKKNAVIYVRTASIEQTEQGSELERQKIACMEYAERNNLNVIQSFGDEAKNREELFKMLNYLNENKDKVHHVLVLDHSRITRDLDYAFYFITSLNRLGISVITIENNKILSEKLLQRILIDKPDS